MPPARAATIGIDETLALLDGKFARLAEAVAHDRYALWLGSGISLGRVAGVKMLIRKVLDFLQQQVVSGDPNCRFRKALNATLDIANVTPAERTAIDLGQPTAAWPGIDSIEQRLAGSYSLFLDIGIDGEEDDFLVWEGIDIVNTYGDPTIEPDVEHLCLAVLALEGVASDMPSANWDGLIEKAIDKLTGGLARIVRCVRPEDLREAELQARLYKFHGCAICARDDEATFRPLLIARRSQINSWIANGENDPLVTHLIDIAVRKPTLMIGLSAQDSNIQAIFAEARQSMAWPWPSTPPAYAFSEDQLGFDQQGLLRIVYKAGYTAATRDDIYDSALIQAYAKSLLAALSLHVICTKLKCLIDLAPGSITVVDRSELKQGIVYLRDTIAKAASPITETLTRAAITLVARLLAMYREGAASPNSPYGPITSQPIQHMVGDASLALTGMREFAVALGLLGRGSQSGQWALEPVDPTDATAGALNIKTAAGPTKLYLISSSHVALRLKLNGHLVDDENAILIQSLDIAAPMVRSPRGAIGRKGKPGTREVSISQLLADAGDYDRLFLRFREELAI